MDELEMVQRSASRETSTETEESALQTEYESNRENLVEDSNINEAIEPTDQHNHDSGETISTDQLNVFSERKNIRTKYVHDYQPLYLTN